MSGEGIDSSELRAAFVAEIQGGLVAMVAVCDYDFFIRHGNLDTADERDISDRPQPVLHAEFIMDFERSGCARNFFQVDVNLSGRIIVKHEELAGLDVCVTQQFNAVRFGSGECALMWENDPRVVILQAAQRDESDSHLARVRAGHQIFLRVNIHRRLRVLGQNPLCNPFLDFLSRARIDIIFAGIISVRDALLDCNQIVWTRSIVPLLHGGSDFVVGLGNNVAQLHAIGIVSQGAEGMNFCHGASRSGASAAETKHCSSERRLVVAHRSGALLRSTNVKGDNSDRSA